MAPLRPCGRCGPVDCDRSSGSDRNSRQRDFQRRLRQQNYTIKQVGELVHQHVPGAELIVDEKDTDRRNYQVSFAKIRNMLNFVPQWTLEQGIEQVLEAIARGEILDYRDAKYSNVKFLSGQGTERLSRSTWAHEMLNEITASS